MCGGGGSKGTSATSGGGWPCGEKKKFIGKILTRKQTSSLATRESCGTV